MPDACSDDGFGSTEAAVVCRQLGYMAGGTAYRHGGGTGLILLDNVSCNAISTRLVQCSSNGWAINDCTHAKDVGVKCT
ncbi:Lysyl oxidase 2, partial [Tetrabaena socialis]